MDIDERSAARREALVELIVRQRQLRHERMSKDRKPWSDAELAALKPYAEAVKNRQISEWKACMLFKRQAHSTRTPMAVRTKLAWYVNYGAFKLGVK